MEATAGSMTTTNMAKPRNKTSRGALRCTTPGERDKEEDAAERGRGGCGDSLSPNPSPPTTPPRRQSDYIERDDARIIIFILFFGFFI